MLEFICLSHVEPTAFSKSRITICTGLSGQLIEMYMPEIKMTYNFTTKLESQLQPRSGASCLEVQGTRGIRPKQKGLLRLVFVLTNPGLSSPWTLECMQVYVLSSRSSTRWSRMGAYRSAFKGRVEETCSLIAGFRHLMMRTGCLRVPTLQRDKLCPLVPEHSKPAVNHARGLGGFK